MSTRTSTRNGSTGPRKATPSKAKPQAKPAAEPKKAEPSPDPEAKAQKPFCGTCGSRIAPEETDPFLGSPLLYDDSGFANLSGALFLCGWQSQTLQKVVDGRPTVTLVGTPVDAAGKALPNRKIVTATWHHRTDIGWVQMAELCGYSRSDGQGFQNRTAEQLVEYVGRNIAEWVLAPIDEAAEPKPESKGKTSGGGGKAGVKASAAPKPDPEPEAPDDSEAPEPTVAPESKGLPAGSTPPAPEPEPETATEPEPDSVAVQADPGDGDSSLVEDAAGIGVEEEVIAEGAAV
ncbi:hypothetical protein [Nocardia sp. NPDC005366]|uniref:hypothetical protein n=1 Tax=Nocardia sp. NPDC005366 TaxID=3156878 RepID=UPI0033AA5413